MVQLYLAAIGKYILLYLAATARSLRLNKSWASFHKAIPSLTPVFIVGLLAHVKRLE